MKILFITDHFYPEVNAAANRVFERAKYWVKWGHEVTVLTSCPNYPFGKAIHGYKNLWFQKEEIEGIKVIRVKTLITSHKSSLKKTLDFFSFFLSSIIFGLFLKKTDILVATTPQFFSGLAGLILSKIKKVPFVLEVGDLWPASVQALKAIQKNFLISIFESIELYLYRNSEHIILLSPEFKNNLIARGIHEEKLSIVLNGSELSPVQNWNIAKLKKEYSLEGKTVLGFLGNFGYAQDLIKLVELCQNLQHRSELVFLLIGDGVTKDSLIQYSLKNNINNIIFIEQQAKNTIQDYWKLCDYAIIHLKYHSTFSQVIPSKIFDAIQLEIPVLYFGPKGLTSKMIDELAIGKSFSTHSSKSFEDFLYGKESTKNHKKYKTNEVQLKGKYTRENQAQEFIQVLKHSLGELIN